MPEITYREAIGQALRRAIEQDKRVFLMGEDIGGYGGSYAVTKGFLADYGAERIKDTPISESAIVGAGIGAALGDLKPVVELMTINFSLLAMDQIVNHAAKLHYMSGGQVSVPLIIRTVTGGGRQLGAQHSQSLEGWYAQVPGLRVVTPATPYDAKGLLAAALKDNNTVIYVEHALLYGLRGEVPEEDYEVPLGVADVKREGKDVTIISYARMVHVSLAAAQKLSAEGIEAEVVDLRTLRPLDIDTVVQSVKKTHRALVVEEGWRTGGIGAEIVSQIQEHAFDYLDGPIGRVASAEVPMPYSKELEQSALPQEKDVVEAVRALLG